jgi:O-Antigen ligase
MARKLTITPTVFAGAGQHSTPQARVRQAASRNLFSRRIVQIVIPFLLLVTVLGTLLGGPKMILIPSFIAVLGWAAFVLPLETVLPAIAFLLLSVNNPSGQPGEGKVKWFLNPLGDFLYRNLPTKFAIADLLIGLLVFRAATVLLLSERDSGLDRRPPRPFAQACMFGVIAIVGLEFWGVFVNGGNFQQSLWQLRVPLLVPCLALAVSVAATDLGIRRIRFALLAAGIAKAIEAIWISFVVGLTADTSGAYITTHSDTMIWVTCMFILLATWFETRKTADLKLLLVLAPFYLASIVVNNRRVAWVAILAGMLFIVAVAHRPVKRQLGRYLKLFWPLIVVYLVIGFASQSQSPIFLPVNKIASVSTKKDASTDTRDIENFNLLVTLKEKPIFGWGFGHEYNEFIVAYSVKNAFSQYRFLPHNSFLGFWALGGVFGPSLYFLLPVVAIFYAVSCRRKSNDPARRAASTWSVCIVIAYLIQAWADLGLQDWVGLVCVGIAYGISGAMGRAVIAEGIPPRPQRVFEYVEEVAPLALRQSEDIADRVPLAETHHRQRAEHVERESESAPAKKPDRP